MLTNKQVCDQLTSMYPDFGKCDEDLEVNWDKNNGAWAVDFGYKGQRIRHYLDNEDATACIAEDQCVGLGIEFGQFR